MLYSSPSSSRIIATFRGFGEFGNAGLELVDSRFQMVLRNEPME